MRYFYALILLLGCFPAFAQEQRQTTSQIAPIGQVDPVKGDLVLRYRPSALQTLVQESLVKVTVDGVSQNFSTRKTMRVGVDPAVDRKVVLHFEVFEEGASESQDPSGIYLITADERGTAISLSGNLNVPGAGRRSLDALGQSDKTLLLDFVKRIFPLFPEGGVKSGDVVYALSLNRLLPIDTLGWNTTNGSAIARLRGVTKWRDRQVAVLDWETDFALYDKASNTSDATFTFSGYSLVDISSGIAIGQNISGTGSALKNGKRIEFAITGKSALKN